MRFHLYISLFLYASLLGDCATNPKSTGSESPIVNIKYIKVEDVKVYDMPDILKEFIKSTPEYAGAKLLANEILGDAEVRKRFENFGYAPYVFGDLNNDGKDEYAFVIINRGKSILLIIKKTVTDELKEEFSMNLDVLAQIKLSDPSVGIFGTPCVIVTSVNMKAVHNVCWDGMKYISVDY
ncbi:MAG: hypothetical protein ACP5KG_04920 [Myxococcota bacterium]